MFCPSTWTPLSAGHTGRLVPACACRTRWSMPLTLPNSRSAKAGVFIMSAWLCSCRHRRDEPLAGHEIEVLRLWVEQGARDN